MNRLISAVPSPMTGVTTTLDYTETYSYTPIGNFISKAGVTQNYTSTKPHAVTSLTNGASFTYDANGNMTLRIEAGVVYTQVWDVDNHLVYVDCTTQPTRFYYGPDGDLVRKENPNGTTLYVSAVYEVFHGTPTSTNITLYYTFNGTRVAIRRDADVYWLHGDHLGSSSVSTNLTGTVVSEVRYLPFGETRWFTGTAPTNRLYTGQRSLMGIGLYDYNARMYSPSLGRFISADTIVPTTNNPQSLNKYSYVFNSPLSFIDSDGHVPYPITIRSFAPFDTFGFGFHGDNRGYSINQDVTSRIRQDINFDTDATTVSANARSDPSWHVSDPSNLKTEHPQSQVKSQLSTATLGKTRTFGFSTWYGGSNPFVSPPVPASITQIDVYASFSIVENRADSYLDVGTNLTGDNFPATEAYITDPAGKSVFIGIGFHEGANKDLAPFQFLPGSNQRQICSMNLRILLDEKGNFASVAYRNWKMTIDQWNGFFMVANPEDIYSFYGMQ